MQTQILPSLTPQEIQYGCIIGGSYCNQAESEEIVAIIRLLKEGKHALVLFLNKQETAPEFFGQIRPACEELILEAFKDGHAIFAINLIGYWSGQPHYMPNVPKGYFWREFHIRTALSIMALTKSRRRGDSP